jgi:hypothetical protein
MKIDCDFHPLASVFPMLVAGEFNNLVVLFVLEDAAV